MSVRRNTWQQTAVRDALEAIDGFVSAQQLHTDLKTEGSTIGLATVYRALSGMVEQGDADTLLSPSGESLFRACTTTDHHHHLICRRCGATEEIAAQVVEDWSKKIASDYGFSDPTHEIDIFGICPNCQRSNPDFNNN
ncbi:MAG TPA: transcriptional repressor [Microbacteriaceae bacterium]|nr:transcriptional repressor [Microbacteriaceae bacterium]